MLKNDDELAGLLGHELAHILAHQNAITVTQLFHQILGVNAVSDRTDISDKLMPILDSIDRDTKALHKATQIIQGQEAIPAAAVLNLLNLVLTQSDEVLEEVLEVTTALRPARYDGTGDQIGVRQRSA